MSDYQQALVDYLAEPENLPTALEISDHIEKVKDKLQYAFWAALQASLEARLIESGLDRSWELVAESRQSVEDYYGCGFSQIGRRYASERCLRVQLEQSVRSTGNQLYYGICWNQKTEADFGTTEIQNLKANLVLSGFRPSPPWWIGGQYLDYRPRRNDFLLAMAERRQDLVEQIAQSFWAFFDAFRSIVIQINAVLVS